MNLQPAPYMPSDPPAGPLAATLAKHNIDPNTLVRCHRMSCTLLKTACIRRYLSAQAGTATWQGTGRCTGDQFYMCVNCAQGEALARGEVLHKREKKKPWQSLAEEREKMKETEKKNRPLCTACGERPAIWSEKAGRVTNGLCKQCYGDKFKKAAAMKAAGAPEAKPIRITIEFTDYPAEFAALQEASKKAMRPVGMQALWLLTQEILADA